MRNAGKRLLRIRLFLLAWARGMKAEDLDKKKQEWRCKTLNIFNWWYPSIVLFTTFFIVQLNFPFPSAEHILDAKREVQEEQQIGMKAIESVPDFDSITSKETEKYIMDVRQLDDGNKEVRIRMKVLNPKHHTHYFIVYSDDFSYREISQEHTGFKND